MEYKVLSIINIFPTILSILPNILILNFAVFVTENRLKGVYYFLVIWFFLKLKFPNVNESFLKGNGKISKQLVRMN